MTTFLSIYLLRLKWFDSSNYFLMIVCSMIVVCMWPWFQSATGETFCGRLGKHSIGLWNCLQSLSLSNTILTSSGVVCMYVLNIDHPERPWCGSLSAASSSSPGSEPCEPFGLCYCELSALSMILYPPGCWDLPYLSCIAHVRYYSGLFVCSMWKRTDCMW